MSSYRPINVSISRHSDLEIFFLVINVNTYHALIEGIPIWVTIQLFSISGHNGRGMHYY